MTTPDPTTLAREVVRQHGHLARDALSHREKVHDILNVALPHLTADDLRDTPAGQQLLADGWAHCADHVALKAVGLSESLHHQNPHRS